MCSDFAEFMLHYVDLDTQICMYFCEIKFDKEKTFLEQKSDWTKLSLCFQDERVLHMKANSHRTPVFQACFTVYYVGKQSATGGTTLVHISLGNTDVYIVQLSMPGSINLKPICEMCIALK